MQNRNGTKEMIDIVFYSLCDSMFMGFQNKKNLCIATKIKMVISSDGKMTEKEQEEVFLE